MGKRETLSLQEEEENYLELKKYKLCMELFEKKICIMMIIVDKFSISSRKHQIQQMNNLSGLVWTVKYELV